jgi:alpha-glucoside transport system permease protein
LLAASLRPEVANAQSGWWTIFDRLSSVTFDNYRSILDNDLIVHSFWNTVLITLPATLLVVGIASLAAYAFAWIDFPGRDWTFVIVVALLVVPIQVALIPVASLYGRLGIYGDILGVVLFHVAFGLPFAIFLLRNFFIGIPRDLMEAARIDGASESRIFFRLILPLGVPALASLAIFQVLFVWNDLLVGLTLAQSKQPLNPLIAQQLRQFGSNLDVIAPAAFISLVVPLTIFALFQRYFVQGLLAGSVK